MAADAHGPSEDELLREESTPGTTDTGSMFAALIQEMKKMNKNVPFRPSSAHPIMDPSSVLWTPSGPRYRLPSGPAVFLQDNIGKNSTNK